MNIPKESAMLIDIQYIKANRKKKEPDVLYIIWKDLATGEKHLETVTEPMMTIYFEKDEFRNHDYPLGYQKLENLRPFTCKYDKIIYAIANDMGPVGQQRLNTYFSTGNYQGLKEFLTYIYVFGADYDIRAWYRWNWNKQFNTTMDKVLTKGFLDIEVDTLEAVGFPDASCNPIDLVTLIDTSTNTSYTFCLIGVDYMAPLSHNFNEEEEKKKEEMYHNRMKTQYHYSKHVSELEKAAHDMFDENYPDMTYKFFFYEDERKLLVHLFQLINTLKLDFIGVWNISFDIPYIMKRLEFLGIDPAEVMCHPDFKIKECWFKKDQINFEVKNKSDYFHCSSYTVFFDQMIIYAAIRKGRSELRSNKLTYIAEKEIGDEKLDYSEIGNIKTLSYNDWLTYVLYNIKDVLLQTGIEKSTCDVDNHYLRSYLNITPYEDIYKNTKLLRNIQYDSFMSQGLVPGENVNTIFYNQHSEDDEGKDGDDDDKFEGALVGDPTLIDNFGEKIFGKKSNSLFKYGLDFDMSAFYPSSIRACNIDPSTLIFKLILPASLFNKRGGQFKYHGITDTQLNKNNDDTFTGDIAKECMDNFQTRNYLTFGVKWFNLPSVAEVYKTIKKKLKG